MLKSLDLSKPVQVVYESGSVLPARIICTDRVGQYPVVALVTTDDGTERLYCFSLTGTNESLFGVLENVPEKVEGWVAVLKSDNGGYCLSYHMYDTYEKCYNIFHKKDYFVKVIKISEEI